MQEPIAYVLEVKPIVVETPIVPKGNRSVQMKVEKITIKSTYNLRNRTILQELVKSRGKGFFQFAKELTRSSTSRRVCSKKPNASLLISNNSSSEEGGEGLESSHFPISLVPYDDSDDEIIVVTPLSIKKPIEGVYSVTNKVG